jgi:hypothetical protein
MISIQWIEAPLAIIGLMTVIVLLMIGLQKVDFL